MRKKVYKLLLMLLLLIVVLKNDVIVYAEEQEEPIAEFIVNGRFLSIDISSPNMEKGTYVSNYNPNVLEIEAIRSASNGFLQSGNISEPGKIEISFSNFFVEDYNEYLATIIFQVISCGSGDLKIESVSVTNDVDTYDLEPIVTGVGNNYNVHDFVYEDTTCTLKLKKVQNDVFKGSEASALDAYRDITKRLEFEEGIIGVNCDCFQDFHSVDEVIIPSSVITISDDAFGLNQKSEGSFQIMGKAMSYAEAYATANAVKFTPTNDLMCGDINGNGEYEAVDALGILKMVVELENTYGYTGDANADGEVTAEDALKVLRMVVGLE